MSPATAGEQDLEDGRAGRGSICLWFIILFSFRPALHSGATRCWHRWSLLNEMNYYYQDHRGPSFLIFPCPRSDISRKKTRGSRKPLLNNEPHFEFRGVPQNSEQELRWRIWIQVILASRPEKSLCRFAHRCGGDVSVEIGLGMILQMQGNEMKWKKF